MTAVRALTAADLGALARMVFALHESEGYDPARGPDAAALAGAYLGAAPTRHCMVAEADAALAGYVTLHLTYETTYASRGAYLGDFYVDPAHRRRGVGRALVAAAARRVRAEGGEHLWWTALPANGGARAFYRRLGAKPEAVIAHALAEDAFDRLAASP
jgi:ribosomal protein S18 acetylase RimI-like enzyme